MIDEMLISNKLAEKIEASGNDYWKKKLPKMPNSHIHVAVMVEPYLTRILSGDKTIESRFSQKKTAPWKKVSVGDVIILKKSGGGFVGIFEVKDVVYKELHSEEDIQAIKTEYNKELCIEDDFFEKKKSSKYVTLIWISHLFSFNAIELSFKNRKAWLTFHDEDKALVPSSKKEGTEKVYCISGKIGSGKTTVGKMLADRIGGIQCSVSDLLKKVLEDRGCESPTRKQLQEIGTEYIKKGWNFFGSSVLEYTKWDGTCPLIIDGVRHAEFYHALKLLCYPASVYGIYLEAGEETIREHIHMRGFEEYDSEHTAEGKQNTLSEIFDINVDINGKSVEKIVDEIKEKLSMVHNKSLPLDNIVTINMLKERVDYFNLIRGWKKYHNPRDLAISINLEAGELLEIFQWNEYQQNLNLDKINEIKKELADVLIYGIDLANACGLDITNIILDKLIINARKYPVKGR